MRWFTNKRKQMAMIQALKPTSKATLKMQCLVICKADIDEATKLYDFFARDMPDLPDYDPAPPTWVDSTKDVAGSFFNWIKENQNTLAGGYEMIRQMTGGKLPPLTLSPLDSEPAPAPEPLPDINA